MCKILIIRSFSLSHKTHKIIYQCRIPPLSSFECFLTNRDLTFLDINLPYSHRPSLRRKHTLSPRDSAIPCVLLRIRTCPLIDPSSAFSNETFANASSPNTDLALRFADRKSHSPDSAASGVRHIILVDFWRWSR